VASQVGVLVVGFLLTSGLGGLLGYVFQKRAWQHQYDTARRDEVLRQAISTFEELATLMDKRIYRMRRLWWAAQDMPGGAAAGERLKVARDGYNVVLFEWNDNLNRLLALVRTYFGRATRDRLELEILEEFVAIGRALEDYVGRVEDGRISEPQPSRVGHRLNHLAHRVYRLDIAMLGLIQDNRLGTKAPAPARSEHVAASERPVVQFGVQGGPVWEVQRLLARAGVGDVQIDGRFGPETEEAVKSFQLSRHLDADGVVGRRTWDTLRSEHVAASERPVVQRGVQGGRVSEVQRLLARAGVGDVQIDGRFGPETEEAVKSFQLSRHLDADGVVGRRTWDTLLGEA